jgi:nitroimidazol reductase NimA-like FMN-containing flavoprotein (pyridoxamine 5'-phosphate oxidase superfamily)
MRELVGNNLTVNINVTFLDGLVLARSAFHHSVNYRSVSVFSTAKQVTGQKEQDHILEVFTEKMCKGRWNDVRKPTAGEWKATMVIAFEMEEASAKVRTGPPVDDDEDYSLDIWAGVLPMSIEKRTHIADPKLKSGVELPPYLG